MSDTRQQPSNILSPEQVNQLYERLTKDPDNSKTLDILAKDDINALKMTSGATILQKICAEGQLKALTALLKKFPKQLDLNARTTVFPKLGANVSALEIACQFESEAYHEITKLLIQHGAEVDEYTLLGQDDDTEQLLTVAIARKHREVVKSLFKKNLSPEVINYIPKSPTSSSPLRQAIIVGDEEIAELLIHKGADINEATLISSVCAFGCEKTFDLIMAKYQERLRQIFSNSKDIPKDLIEETIKKRIATKIDEKNIYGDTPLISAFRKGHFPLVKKLIDFGADVNARSGKKNTPLQFACDIGNEEIVRILLKHPVDVNSHNNELCTPLLLACSGNHSNVVDILLNHETKPHVNHQNNLGETALMHGIANGNKEIVQKLLEQSEIDINIKTNQGQTAISEAINRENTQILKLILEKKPQFPSFEATLDFILFGKENENHILLSIKNAVTVKNEKVIKLLAVYQPVTILFFALYDKKKSIVDEILAQPNILEQIKNHFQALLKISIASNEIWMIKHLIKNGLNQKDSLALAGGYDHQEVLELLVTEFKITETIDANYFSELPPQVKGLVEKNVNEVIHKVNRRTKKTRSTQEGNLETVNTNDIKPVARKKIPHGDSEDIIKHLKLLLGDLIETISFTEPTEDERVYYVKCKETVFYKIDQHNQYELNKFGVNRVLKYVKESSGYKDQMAIVDDTEMQITIKAGTTLILCDPVKQGVKKIIGTQRRKTQIAVTQESEQNVKQTRQKKGNPSSNKTAIAQTSTEPAVEAESPAPVQAAVIVPEMKKEVNVLIDINENEAIESKHIAALIFGIANQRSNLTLDIDNLKQEPHKWTVKANLMQVGVGTEIFFNAIVAAINETFKGEKIIKIVKPKPDEVLLTFNFKQMNFREVIKHKAALQTAYDEAFKKITEEQKVKKDNKVEPAKVEETAPPIADQPKAANKKKKKIKPQKKENSLPVSIIIPQPLPKDLEITELCLQSLQRARKLVEGNPSSQETLLRMTLDKLSIYWDLFSLIKITYDHYHRLGIDMGEITKLRDVFADFPDYILIFDLQHQDFYTSSNPDSLLSLITKAYVDLKNDYQRDQKGKSITPISLNNNSIIQHYYVREESKDEKKGNKIEIPRHVGGGAGVLTDVKTLLESIHRILPEKDKESEFENDMTARNVVKTKSLQLGFLIRQLRKHEVAYCQDNFHCKLSFTSYRASLFKKLEPVHQLKIESFKRKDGTEYQLLLPHLLGFYKERGTEELVLFLQKQKLQAHELLLLLLELRNVFAHKNQKYQSRSFEGMNLEFLLIVLKMLNQRLVPAIQEILDKQQKSAASKEEIVINIDTRALKHAGLLGNNAVNTPTTQPVKPAASPTNNNTGVG